MYAGPSRVGPGAAADEDGARMTFEQTAVIAIILGVLALFAFAPLRHDVVAFVALAAAVLVGVVPADGAFLGFAHPATVTVAFVLVLSRALSNAGAVDALVRVMTPASDRPSLQVAGFGMVAAPVSALMNNVGALALLMPAAVQAAAKAKLSPATLLMPLSFASILGGMVTLIGTPPNIIVASYRGESVGAPFAMFDYAPVGAVVALTGVAFIALVGWRLIPRERRAAVSPEDLFQIDDYVAEVTVPEGSEAIGKTARQVEKEGDHATTVVALIRKKRRMVATLRTEPLRAGDLLVVEAGPKDIDKFVHAHGLELAEAGGAKSRLLRSDDVALIEAVVPPRSRLDGRTATQVRLRSRYRLNVLAVSRQGRPLRERLRALRFRAGDVLWVQGDPATVAEDVAALGCLPLAERGLKVGKRHQAGLTAAVFAAAVLAAAVGVVPLPIAFAVAVLAVVLLNVVSVRELYDAVDWPVIVLLGAMIPVGGALETTGTTELIAALILDLAAGVAPALVLALLLVVTMTLSDVLNNAATAVIAAPIALGIAQALGVSPDPFLMAVAVGASSAFLTPIGHQNNTLIMGPGGYRFGDYWRLGLPLEVLIVVVSVPMILWVWPL